MEKEALDVVADPTFRTSAEAFIGSYGWLLLAALLGFFFKEAVHKAVEGFMVWMGHDFDNDDVLYISGRQARIIRVGIFKTVFYMTDRGTKMIVPNDRLKMLTVEKKLDKNGGTPYLWAGSEAGFIEQYLKEKGKALKAVQIDPQHINEELGIKQAPKPCKKDV
jgi:hypothetical protein